MDFGHEECYNIAKGAFDKMVTKMKARDTLKVDTSDAAAATKQTRQQLLPCLFQSKQTAQYSSQHCYPQSSPETKETRKSHLKRKFAKICGFFLTDTICYSIRHSRTFYGNHSPQNAFSDGQFH
jgi:hypothetical protein